MSSIAEGSSTSLHSLSEVTTNERNDVTTTSHTGSSFSGTLQHGPLSSSQPLPSLSYGTELCIEFPACCVKGLNYLHFYQNLHCPRIQMNIIVSVVAVYWSLYACFVKGKVIVIVITLRGRACAARGKPITLGVCRYVCLWPKEILFPR